MAYYNKVGLLILSPDQKKFLVCEKGSLPNFIMPGGKIEKGEADIDCLRREINEELGVKFDEASLKLVGEYRDLAAGATGQDIKITLYQAKVIGEPKPRAEIKSIYWIGKDDFNNPKQSPIIKNKIIPDLIKRGILK